METLAHGLSDYCGVPQVFYGPSDRRVETLKIVTQTQIPVALLLVLSSPLLPLHPSTLDTSTLAVPATLRRPSGHGPYVTQRFRARRRYANCYRPAPHCAAARVDVI